MFIDIHTHAFRKPNGLFPHMMTVEQLIEAFDEAGIEKGAVLPMVSPEIYLPQANEDVLDMAEKYPDRIIPFCNIDPRAWSNSPFAPLDNLLQYYKDKGCKGIGEVMPNLEITDPLVQNLFCCAEKVGLPLIYEGAIQKTGTFGLYDEPNLPGLEFSLQRFPELKILGHGPVFWTEIAKLETLGERGVLFHFQAKGQIGDQYLNRSKIKEEGIVPKLMRKYPNLYGDLSDGTAYLAFARDEDFGAKFMEEFQDRLLFGTDMFTVGAKPYIDSLMIKWKNEGKISETAFNKIARENAIRLLDL